MFGNLRSAADFYDGTRAGAYTFDVRSATSDVLMCDVRGATGREYLAVPDS